MYLHLVAMGLGAAGLAAVLSWAVALRHGWRVALVLPLLALLALVGMLWWSSRLGLQDGIGAAAAAVVFAAPTMTGALLGIVIAARRGR